MTHIIHVNDKVEFETSGGKFGFFQFACEQYCIVRLTGERNRFQNGVFDHHEIFDVDEFCRRNGFQNLEKNLITVSLFTKFEHNGREFGFFQFTVDEFVLFCPGNNNRFIDAIFKCDERLTIEEIFERGKN